MEQEPTSGRDGFYFDKGAADHAQRFFEKHLRHVTGVWANKPFRLLAWQAEQVIRPLFGWMRPDGTRKYRTVYVEVPKKNGKSEMASGVADYCTLADGEPAGRVFSAAADREQAAIVFDTAKDMILASPSLRKRAKLLARSIRVPATNTIYRVLSADVKTKHGLNASAVIFDELHAQPNRHLWDTLYSAGAARRQPIVFATTTAGFDPKSICFEVHRYADKVKRGVIKDDSFLPVIYAADEEDDWEDPAIWAKANPSLGITLTEDYLRDLVKKAKESLAYQNTFRRLHLNQWTRTDKRAIDLNLWDKSAGVVDEAALIGQPCWGGLDLAQVVDITAWVKVFKVGEDFKVIPTFWIPEDRVEERSRKDGVPYAAWVKAGLLKTTPGATVDYNFLRETIVADSKKFKLMAVGYDAWGAEMLVQQLMAAKINMVPIKQSLAGLTGPTKEMFVLMFTGRLHHGGNEVLRWMADNLVLQEDGSSNYRPHKGRSNEKIDGIVAMIMALDQAIRGGGKAIKSPYATRGIRSL